MSMKRLIDDVGSRLKAGLRLFIKKKIRQKLTLCAYLWRGVQRHSSLNIISASVKFKRLEGFDKTLEIMRFPDNQHISTQCSSI